jgi:type VI protein secretion system component VasF
MDDDHALALLQEIRDLQKQQLEVLRTSVANQQQSLTNQQQSLTVQQQVVERQKYLVARGTRLWMFVLLSILVLFFMNFFPFFFKLLLRL